MLLPAAPRLLSHPPAKSFQEPGRHQGDAKGGGCGCRGLWVFGGGADHPRAGSVGTVAAGRLQDGLGGARSTVPSPGTSRPAGASAYQHCPEGQAWAPAVSQQAQCDVLAITVLHPSQPLSQQAQYGAPAIPEPCPNKTSVVSHQAQYRVPSSPVPCPIKPRAISQQAQCRVLTSPAPYPSNPSTASQQAQDGAPENPVSCPSKPNAMSQQYQCRVLTSQREGDPSYPQCWGGDGGAPAQAPVALGRDLPAGGWEPRCPTPASPRCWQLPAPLPPRRGG